MYNILQKTCMVVTDYNIPKQNLCNMWISFLNKNNKRVPKTRTMAQMFFSFIGWKTLVEAHLEVEAKA